MLALHTSTKADNVRSNIRTENATMLKRSNFRVKMELSGSLPVEDPVIIYSKLKRSVSKKESDEIIMC